MFERTLQDLIRGLRAHKASSKAQEEAFIQEAMTEIREELKGNDMALKAEGVLKVCYVSALRLSRTDERANGTRSCSCCIRYHHRPALLSMWSRL